jgi:type II secretory ATPase GspE/PulE/Tfp pilus assembly ATPase PilB-like protein
MEAHLAAARAARPARPAPGAPAPAAAQAPLAKPRFDELGQYEIDPDSARKLPQEFCEKKSCVILGRISAQNKVAAVPVGMLDVANDELVREIESQIGRRVRPVQLNAYEVKQAIRRAYGLESGHTGRVAQVNLDFARVISFEAEQAPSAMLDDLLSTAIRYGATDIHIETYQKDVDLRFRRDGVLRQISTPLSPDNVKKVISRVKVLCNLDIAAKPQPMDGRFSAKYTDENGRARHVHFRTSIVPGPYGEDCVLRLLDPSVARRELGQLGMSSDSLHVLKTLLNCPSGLILITGPTGSGKTTTLYASLHEMHSEDLKICTVEDPIEYEVPKVNQRQIDDDIGFAAYARALMRQDPDVILIGEIRDEETAQVAVRAGSTGHLVLSTVHTDDAVAAVSRLRTLGVDDEILSTTLLGSTSQRLVRRVCKACKTQYQPKADTFVRFYNDDPRHPFLRGRGCEKCDGTGYQGQFGIFEVFVVDDAISAAIGRHATLDEIRKLARERGFVPLVEQALERVKEGETTIEEVERTVRPLFFV